MTDLDRRRRFYAEEIEMVANLRTPALVEALATVPREQYLPPGPWMVRSEADDNASPRQTRDAEPSHVYHNVAIAIDPARQLFNGAPGVLSMAIDALDVRPGDRVLHVGTGLGYYTAVLAACAGPAGRVLGIEVDADLAKRARQNLSSLASVDVREGDGTATLDAPVDVALINAGVTHPLDAWLDALARGARLVLPLTASMPAMGPIGKGFLILITASPDGSYAVRMITFIAVYSAIGVRDDAMNAALGRALMKGPFMPATRLRRDTHDAGPACWLHGPTCCFSIN